MMLRKFIVVPWTGFAAVQIPLTLNLPCNSVMGGVICRHLAYAYQLTGEPKYLEIGRSVLRRLIDDQDWSDDPKRRGAVELSPMTVSLLFFGVPFFLGKLSEVEMGESEERG